MRGLGRTVCLGLAVAVVVLLYTPPVEARPVDDASQVLRFHVVARSDAPDDQARKYLVRDTLLELLSEQLQKARDADEARRAVLGCMDKIEEMAREAGGIGEVTVRLSRVSFPAVDYTTVALPAGEYWALQVILGSGEGDNWWCVLFPSLCLLGPAGPPADDEPPGVSSLRFRFILGKVLHRMFTGGIGEHSEGWLYRYAPASDLQ